MDLELKKKLVFKNMVVQLSPEAENPMFATCFMIVTEIRDFGVVGYVQSLGKDGQIGRQAFYRAKWQEFEMVGNAIWGAE